MNPASTAQQRVVRPPIPPSSFSSSSSKLTTIASQNAHKEMARLEAGKYKPNEVGTLRLSNSDVRDSFEYIVRGTDFLPHAQRSASPETPIVPRQPVIPRQPISRVVRPLALPPHAVLDVPD